MGFMEELQSCVVYCSIEPNLVAFRPGCTGLLIEFRSPQYKFYFSF